MLLPSVISSAYSSSPPTGMPRSDGSDLYARFFEHFGNVESRSVAFHRGAKRKDDFFDLTVARFDSTDQRFYFDIVRAYTVYGRYASAQHMKDAIVLSSISDGKHVGGVFYHAHSSRITVECLASAVFRIRNDVARLAIFDVLSEINQEIQTRDVAFSSGCLSKCNAKRNAVFLPIPGSLAISSTAFSTSLEGYSIYTMAALMPASEMPSRIGFSF